MKICILNAVINGFISSIKALPRRHRKVISDGLARLIYLMCKKVQKRSVNNVKLGFPNLSEKEAYRVGLRAYQSICFGLIESFWMKELEVDLSFDDKAEQILRSNQGASISTLHMSCYEVVALAVARVSDNSTTLSKIPRFLKSGAQVYKNAGIDVVDKRDKSSFFKLVKAVKSGHYVTLHADHFADEVPVTFFGQQTKAPCGSAMLSAMGNKPLLFAYAYLAEDGRYKVHFETVSEQGVAKGQEQLQAVMQDVYGRFEKVILEHSDQWYWSYNRWPDLQIR